METCRIEISKELLQILLDSEAITPNDYKLLLVDVSDYDYSTSDVWKAAKAVSDKRYKELKRIEFNIRHNIT